MEPETTCRDEVLDAVGAITRATGRDEFTIRDIVDHMRGAGSRYSESTIRTHVASRLCANAPDHHDVTYDDLERVRPGIYRLRRR
jgi:hypothetical protein